MPTATKRTPRRQSRSEDSRTKILNAAIELIGEVGPFGLTLALAAERAGVSRALPTYQFNTRHELLVAAAIALLGAELTDRGLGLEALLAWMRAELDEAAAAGAPVRARLVLLLGPPDLSTCQAVGAYWSSRLSRIEGHLEWGRLQQQMRTDLNLPAVASVLLGQLHGEMVRSAFERGQPGSEEFLALVRTSIAPIGTTKRQVPARPARGPTKDQHELF